MIVNYSIRICIQLELVMSAKANTTKRVKAVLAQLRSINAFPKYMYLIGFYCVSFYSLWVLFWIYHYHGYPTFLKFTFNNNQEVCEYSENDIIKNTHLIFGLISGVGLLTVLIVLFHLSKESVNIAADTAILIWGIITFGISAISNLLIYYQNFQNIRLQSYLGNSNHFFAIARWVTLYIVIISSYFVFDIKENDESDKLYKLISTCFKVISIIGGVILMNIERSISFFIVLVITLLAFIPIFTDVYYTYSRYRAVHDFCNVVIDHNIVPRLIGVKKRYGKSSPAYTEDENEQRTIETNKDFLVQGISKNAILILILQCLNRDPHQYQ